MRVLSLGAGVQSSTVLLMSCIGELPKLDCAIFADTGWEPAAVYKHLHWLEDEAAKAGIPVYRVGKRTIRRDALAAQVPGTRFASLPLYTANEDGSLGIIRRECTGNYKVEPIERKIRDLLGLKPRERWPKVPTVELWMGISCDEVKRLRLPQALWKTHFYPLVFEKRFRRSDCLKWLEANGFPRAPRSACIGCPFHSDAEWRALRDGSPEEWADAVAFDEAIRRREGVRGDLFLHQARVPLVQVDLSPPPRMDGVVGKLDLDLSGFREECQGYCGV